MTWSGTDAGSGLASYDVQYCQIDCDLPKMGLWHDWLTGVTATQALMDAEEAMIYFRSRARDQAGNEEPEHGRPDAWTIVDLTPPATHVNALPAYSQAAFTVTWGGSDSFSGIASFDVQYCAGDCDDPAGGTGNTWTNWLTCTTATAAAFAGGQHAQSYAFRCRARDRLGHLEPWPIQPDTATVVDAAAPSSTVAGLPAYSPLSFSVSWSGEDQGAGIAAYDVQACVAPTVTPDCWVDWQVGTVSATGLFTGVHGQAAAFRSRAYDAAGNREDYPAGPDAWTVVDGVGPHTWFEPSPGGKPSRLRWTGQDAPAGLAHYDLYFRDEAAASWTPWLLGVTTTQSFFTVTAGHTYHFCVRGVDRVGNVEDKNCPAGLGNWPPAGEAVLAFPPTSRVEPLPPTAPGASFTVHWAGPPGAAYDVQVLVLGAGAQWEDWLVGTARTSAEFIGVPGRAYAFRCRAVSADDGTVEPWPWSHDAYTSVPEAPPGRGRAPASFPPPRPSLQAGGSGRGARKEAGFPPFPLREGGQGG